MKQLLIVLLIALVFSLVVASQSFSAQMHEDGAPRHESTDQASRVS